MCLNPWDFELAVGLMMVGNESNFPRRKDFVACCSYRTELSCVVRLNVIARVAHVCFQKVEKCYGRTGDKKLFFYEVAVILDMHTKQRSNIWNLE